MLKFDLNGDILHVTETLMSFTTDTVTHWYYDIKNWRVSSYGNEGDTPDRDMTPDSIEWCKKHHLPNVMQSS